MRPPAAQKHAEVHLVFPPLEPGEEPAQPAELVLRHAVANEIPLLVAQLAKRDVERQADGRR